MNASNWKGDELEARLRQDAARLPPSVPEGMEQRILGAVQESGRPDREFRRSSAWFPLALAGGALALVLGIVLARLPPAGAPRSEGGSPTADEAELASAMKSMPIQVLASFQTRASALLDDDPLRADANALYSDARSAARFLALNFLPAPPTQPRPAGPDEG